MSGVRVRFAPSPTGLLHVGGARTALFNWLYARHTGGVFVLRIEDTDKARNTAEARAVIFEGLRWLGLDWDEGPSEDGGCKGDRGPYYQSERSDIYARYVEQLLAAGKAYREADGAVRFRTPKTPCTVKDLICGDISFDRTTEPDLVIVRKDGSPVFHLVNVVDDLEMGITHVIRGEDHLSNTHKHLALFEALGAAPPSYAHIPLILNPNGSKMSKRDEGAAISHYIEEGYLPEAVRNYLCLLGWSPKDNRELIGLDEVVEKFDLPQINRSNARFDLNKLYWINGEYWRTREEAEFMGFAHSFLKVRGMIPEGLDASYLDGCIRIVREKIKVGRDLVSWMAPLLNEEFPYDEKGAGKTLGDSASVGYIEGMIGEFEGLDPFTVEGTEAVLKRMAEKEGVKVGALVHPCRMAVSGQPVGPSLYHMLEVMGRERVLRRMRRTLSLLREGKWKAAGG